jgi:hypothetical protein
LPCAIDTVAFSLTFRLFFLKKNIITCCSTPGGTAGRPERTFDRVEWAGFDEAIEEDGELHLYLTLGYVNGWQVWDVNESSGRGAVSVASAFFFF